MKICPICGKNDLKNQGALNMHMYHCKMKNNYVPRETIQEECLHDWRFLNLKSPIERKAYETGGFIEVCKKCQELKGENE